MNQFKSINSNENAPFDCNAVFWIFLDVVDGECTSTNTIARQHWGWCGQNVARLSVGRRRSRRSHCQSEQVVEQDSLRFVLAAVVEWPLTLADCKSAQEDNDFGNHRVCCRGEECGPGSCCKLLY